MDGIRKNLRRTGGLVALTVILGAPAMAGAHCDALDGPVVQDARIALERGEVTPVLKWVLPEDEGVIRENFEQTLDVRTESEKARVLADRYFLETLVRIHRAGEGAPYTGLKPAGEGTDSGPAVDMTDKALEAGSVDVLVRFVTSRVEQGLRKRFAHAHETKQKADQNVEAGRKFVEAYVNLVHYAKDIYAAADREGGPHGGAAPASLHGPPEHP